MELPNAGRTGACSRVLMALCCNKSKSNLLPTRIAKGLSRPGIKRCEDNFRMRRVIFKRPACKQILLKSWCKLIVWRQCTKVKHSKYGWGLSNSELILWEFNFCSCYNRLLKVCLSQNLYQIISNFSVKNNSRVILAKNSRKFRQELVRNCIHMLGDYW